MKKDYTDITVVLDRSGSMHSTKEDTLGGFNSLLEKQKEVKGKATFTLVQFDHEYQKVYDGVDIKLVEPLTDTTYQPRGSTALLDAIGRTINNVGERLWSLNESQRPEKVVFVIITDGFENCSTEFTKAQINKMIEHQREKYSWEILFIGSNQDAIAEGTTLGIRLGSSFTYGNDSKGIRNMYASLSSNMANYRGGNTVNMDFTEKDREKQENEIQSVTNFKNVKLSR